MRNPMQHRRRMEVKEAAAIVASGSLYRKTTTVRHGRIAEPIVVSNRENEDNNGEPGDYLAADGHGGYYVISAEYDDKNYEKMLGEL